MNRVFPPHFQGLEGRNNCFCREFDEKEGRRERYGFRTHGTCYSQPGAERGEVLPLHHTAVKGERDRNPHTAEASKRNAQWRKDVGRLWGVRALQTTPPCMTSHSDLSVPSIVPLLQTTPTAAPLPMPFPTPDTPPLCSVSKHPRGSFLERMRPRTSEVLTRPQERNSAAQLSCLSLSEAGGLDTTSSTAGNPPELSAAQKEATPGGQQANASRSKNWSSPHLDFSSSPPDPGPPSSLTSVPVGYALLALQGPL